MELYIHSQGIVSAAGDNNNEQFLNAAPQYESDKLLCDSLDYAAWIPPMQLRRMSKVVKMGVAASKICLQKAGLERPDAISIGTGFGCLYDTEQFLSKMVAQDEQMLTPTSFIQSTHNTVGGQIALLSGCHGHNLTFVQRGHSFEHAVINAQLYSSDHPGENILVGGLDELTSTSLDVLKQTGIYSNEPRDMQSVLYHSRLGSIAGEGAGFVLLSSEKKAGVPRIKGLSLFISRDTATALQKVQDFLYRQELTMEDISLVFLGQGGDGRYEPFYHELQNDIFKGSSKAFFKHLSGEYPTSGAFALALAAHITGTGIVPPFVLTGAAPVGLRNILIINNYMDHYTCWHLEMA